MNPKPDLKDNPNFGWMTPWLARGAHPNPAGFRWLTDNGVKSIVNLRAEDNTEVALTELLPFTPVQIPVVDNTAPSTEQALMWLQLCAEQRNRPVFVHCQAGHGRTSTFCMLVRLAQGWKLKDAIDEERTFGFNPDHDPAQIAFIEGLRDQLKAGTLTLPTL